ncbi:hypothetical protein WSM22_01610 [Cytophagales bacterium WSM2-2]|nr:hypothetical protein WSM22_01610 [Cytophagales bacterium WSM2-2]
MVQKKNGLQTNRIESASYTIPIVVHVINNGEAVGSGTNISDAQILSQIQVLNDDFQRMNADAASTLNEFKPVAGSFPITFVMAKQDPNGQATTGIVRVNGNRNSWSLSDNYTLKALSYWPAEDYLNIWIANMSGGVLGFTQTPVSSTLQGLDESSSDRITDGIIIHYRTYGTNQAAGGSSFNLMPKYNIGRTTTHEVGHFFGLRHVWGDVFNCFGTDYVSDTPTQDTNFIDSCPGTSVTDCSASAMFGNYMNYTDDACMNLFSKGQVDRMDIVINNSPRRLSLLTSHGLLAPAPLANDVGIKNIVTPGISACGNVTPSITIQNYGSNNVTSCQISFSLNGNSVETKTFSVTLAPAGTSVLNFSPIAVTAGSSYNFSFQVIQTNAGVDGNSANNSTATSVAVPVAVPLPMTEPFNSLPLPANWTINNPDGLITWKNVTIGSNQAMYIDCYDYENQGASDWLITPVIDLTSATVGSLSFDYAYATYTGGSNEVLKVLVATSCDFSSAVEIFNKTGSALTTATATSSSFTPTSSQWKNVGLSLSQFIGQKIQIAFVGINDYGNNLYLDNVVVLNTPITQFTLNTLVSPSPVVCSTGLSPVVSVTNNGNTTISSLVANTYVNSQKSTATINLTINPNETKNVSLPAVTLNNGSNTLAIALNSPNGIPSLTVPNDSTKINITVNASADIVPLRENFNNGLEGWTSVSRTVGGAPWISTSTTSSKQLSMEYAAYSNTAVGQQAWLVSPVLDFSNAQKASVFFENSYGYRGPGSETLQVYGSTDCGTNFDNLLFSTSASSLSIATTSSPWLPTADVQWRKNYISLDDFAGKANARIAFVITNSNGNNFYIDNIEFFADDNLNPVSVDPEYSVYGGMGVPVNVTFNLPEKQLVRMQTYDMVGRVITDDLLPDTLNQTYTIDLPNASRGIYIVKIQTPHSTRSTRIVLGF